MRAERAPAFLAGKTVGGPAAARMTIDGREYINFCGSGYLALTGVAEIRTAVRGALDRGAPFAQHLTAVLGGIDPIFDEVERAAARACGSEASVYFASGYLIGTIGLASLENAFKPVFLDEAAHYNLKDAARLSGHQTLTFRHCDVESLRGLLKRHVRAKRRPLVVTDGVFAATGRVAPLAEYAEVLETYGGRLLVDESHGFGVIGQNGRGAREYCGVEPLSATGATLSKAFCAQGAIVGCSAAVAERLRATPQVRGASAGSPLSAVAATASLAYVASRPEIRAGLRATSDYLRAKLRALGLDVSDSPAPIVSFQWGDPADMQALQARLLERGICIKHSTYPGSGPHGTMRCAVFRDHTREDIDALVDALTSLEL